MAKYQGMLETIPGEKTMKTRANWIAASVVAALAAGCCTLNQPGACGGDTATIMAAEGQLHMRPACLVINGGESVTLRLRVSDDVRSVQTRPSAENPFADWLRGSSERGGEIVLTAPSTKDEKDTCAESVCEYKFEIAVEGVGILDPRLQVRY